MDGCQVERVEFDAFVRHHLPALARYAYVLSGNRHAAEDLLQETLLRVAGAWPRVRRDGHPLAYTRTAMVRLHVSRLRRLRRRAQLAFAHDDASADHAGTEDAGMVRVEQRELLRPALDSLSPLQRAVVVLTYFDDADDETIAEVVNRRRATVRSVRHRALHALRTQLTGTRLTEGGAGHSNHNSDDNHLDHLDHHNHHNHGGHGGHGEPARTTETQR